MALVWQKYVPTFMATQYDGTNGDDIMEAIGATNVSTDEEGTITFDDDRDSGRQLYVNNWVIADSMNPGIGMDDNPPWVSYHHISTSPSDFYATDTTEDYIS